MARLRGAGFTDVDLRRHWVKLQPIVVRLGLLGYGLSDDEAMRQGPAGPMFGSAKRFVRDAPLHRAVPC